MITKHPQHYRTVSVSKSILFVTVLSTFMLTACGGGSGDSEQVSTSGNVNSVDAPQDDPVEISASNGVQVSYTSEAQKDSIEVEYVAQEWSYMQTCLGIVAPAPTVIIIAGDIELITSEDDAVRDFDGRVKATSSVLEDGAVVMQVSEDDFDGSLGSVGGYLRSIMGRYLWLSDSQPERDYPFNCASNG